MRIGSYILTVLLMSFCTMAVAQINPNRDTTLLNRNWMEIKPLPDLEKVLSDRELTYRMPVAGLEGGNFRMPVAVPDTLRRYTLQIVGDEQKQEPKH